MLADTVFVHRREITGTAGPATPHGLFGGQSVVRRQTEKEVASTLLLPPRHYLNDGYGIKSWLLTRDHKRIALLYLAAVTVFFFPSAARWRW